MKICLLLLSYSLLLHADAQYARYIVQFKDKGSGSYTFNNPSQYLSARAIQRRTRYTILIDSLDLPVTPSYLDSIRNSGTVTILSTSKWLNQVLIQTTEQNAINKIRNLSFVKNTQGIGLRTSNSGMLHKFEEVIKPFDPSTRTQRTSADFYSYGASFNQVHIHEGEFLHNKGYRGESMQIAVLDAGFFQYKTITAFDSIRLNTQVLGERDFVAFDNSVNEDNDHGMYCLSILSANWPGKMVGTAPKSKYWLLRTEDASREFPIEEHNWLVGAEFADSSGTDMISSSLGYTNFDDPSFNHSYIDFYKNATMVSKGATIAARKGMIVMNSAGNEGGSNWKYLSFPADGDSVCAVGSVNGLGVVSGFSSYGYPGKVKPNIVSIGEGTVIAGRNNQPVSGNGTSFSNPNVAGLIACLWQAFPNVNNMKILDAVYKSSSSYNNPDDRYGFGIPNFRLAYQLLKKDQNNLVYGNKTLFATPDPFNTKIDATFIGQVNGTAKLLLLNSAGQVIATQNFITEKEEVYTYSFSNLLALPAGTYTINYSDSLTANFIAVQKQSSSAEWFVVAPNPFHDNLSLYIRAPTTGNAGIRLIDVKGRTIQTINLQLNQNEVRSVRFSKAGTLPRGVYIIEFISGKERRILKAVKL